MKNHHTLGMRMMVLVCILSLLVCCFAVCAYAADGDAQTPPEKPAGSENETPPEKPAGDENGTPPAKPEGDENETPPEKPADDDDPADVPADNDDPADVPAGNDDPADVPDGPEQPEDDPKEDVDPKDDPSVLPRVYVSVVWEHGDNPADEQPAFVEVTVNGETEIASADNEWHTSFAVEDYSPANMPVPGAAAGYVANVTSDGPDSYTITYTYDPDGQDDEPADQPADQPTDQPAGQPTDQPAGQPTDQPADQTGGNNTTGGNNPAGTGTAGGNKPSGTGSAGGDKPSGSGTTGSASGEQPKTGDENEPIFWTVLTGALLVTMGAVVVIAKKNQGQEK